MTSGTGVILFVSCHTARGVLAPALGRLWTEADFKRVAFIKELLRQYSCFFGITLHAHAVTQREIRLVLQSHPEQIEPLDDPAAAQRWLSICPTLRRSTAGNNAPTLSEVQALCLDRPRMAQIRSRLSDIAWWMRLLQQRVAQYCNRETKSEGGFWSERYRSHPLPEALLTEDQLSQLDLSLPGDRTNARSLAAAFSPPRICWTQVESIPTISHGQVSSVFR
ncbi:MAG: hypothetical protein RLZZ436_3301 [Planctomycetota bacterium]|jgi:hypothetical protein